MCGIAGYLQQRPQGEEAETLARMMTAIARRGPDSKGVHTWPGVWFGHQRLAILDLSPAGAQPMLTADGKTGVVFNGCIYNYRELRDQLQAVGHHFHSQCDTEVLLHGFRQWGMAGMLPRLRGMFAFAIWDENSQTLSLARDRMGVKPLVYASFPGGFAFASSISALEAAGVSRSIRPSAVLEYLEYGFITNTQSVYDNCEKLRDGEWLERRSDGSLRKNRYWDPPHVSSDSTLDFEQAVQRTEELLIEAVRLRLQSDVPIAALLSGGVDSGLVCWAMREANARVRAFTVGSPGEPEDESEAARQVARHLDIPHEIIPLSQDSGFGLDTFLDAYSEPFAPESAFAVLRVAEAVKPHATVLLTGDGGDESFLGYPFFYNVWRAQRAAKFIPKPLASAWPSMRSLLPSSGPLHRLGNFLSYTTGGIGEYARLHEGLPWLEQNGLLGDRLKSLKLPQRQIPFSAGAGRHLLDDALQLHWDLHFTGEFMTKVDQGTAHFALEARAPFLDHVLWEFAATLPAKLRFHGGTLKAILRAIARRRLGHAVSNRPKQGFTVPVDRWLANPKSPAWEPLLDHPRVVSEGWIAASPLAAAIAETTRQKSVPPALRFLLLFEYWLRRRVG